jgi:hypothetical protein
MATSSNKINEDWEKYINSQIELSASSRSYVCVKVLIVYWEEGDAGFKREGRELRAMFADKETFGFATDEFAIPSSESHLHLLNFIASSLLEASTYAKEQRGTSLVIIHYGGHGDRNDDRHSGEQRRSVWAA